MDSLRELVEQIDAHVEMIGTEATSNPPTKGPHGEDVHLQPPDLRDVTRGSFLLTAESALLLFAFILIAFYFKLVCPCRRVVATKWLFSGFLLNSLLNLWI